jgi:Rha family phage regulatory protein
VLVSLDGGGIFFGETKMQLLNLETTTTMSSLEIAELTGKEHGHVMRDIRSMLEALGGQSNFGASYRNSQNKEQPMYKLPYDETVCLLTGYDAKARMAVIKRWKELEAMQATTPKVPQTLAVPNFSNPAEAARAWADQYEARLLAESTKAQIGSKREATAMNTASQAVKHVNKLQIELDQSKQYASIKRMENIYHGQKFNWRLLKDAAMNLDISAIDIFDANYGTVKAYHADVWAEAYALKIE